jgi:pimeloyl-ACP methyl ester carboxylesterase
VPYANANGVKLYYERAGEGTPFIIHAHHHNKYMPFQVPYFSQFYDVIVTDRRGTGRSDEPAGPWTSADLAADLAGLMDDLGIEKAIVGGSSLGGIVSSQFGLDFPERTLALIVGHTTPYLWPLGVTWLEEQIALAASGQPAVVFQPRSYDWEPQGPPTTDPVFLASATGQYLKTLTLGLGGTPAGAAAAINVLTNWDQRPRYPELNALDVPVMVLVGGNEPQKTIELAYDWSKEFKRGEYVVLPNTHHNASNENPIAWNTAVHDFLKRNGL